MFVLFMCRTISAAEKTNFIIDGSYSQSEAIGVCEEGNLPRKLTKKHNINLKVSMVSLTVIWKWG